MSYSVKTIGVFEKQAKRLAKKYPSLKTDLYHLIQKLVENPNQGTPIGKNCYKIRLAISSKGKGKSGGARVIIAVYFIEKIVFMLAIYDKSEKANITDDELRNLLNDVPR